MVDWAEHQGIRKAPFISSLVLLILSSTFVVIAINANWASMTAESDYSEEQIENAEIWGYDLPERSVSMSFGLRTIEASYTFDGNTFDSDEEALEDLDVGSDAMDIDWAKWDSAGKVTFFALWVGLGAVVLSILSLTLGAIKSKDSAFGSAVILSGIAATIVIIACLNWMISGGGFGDFDSLEEDLMKSDGFGITTGFILSLIAGLLLLTVPFILIWSQEIPIDKLLPFGGGYGGLDIREYNPSARLNGSIGLMLVCMLIFSGIAQGASSVVLTKEDKSDSASAGNDDIDEEELLDYWVIDATLDEIVLSSDTTSAVSLENGETRNIIFGKDVMSTPFQRGYFSFRCTDGGEGEAGAPIPNDETDVLHLTTITNDGQEFSWQEDCDGDSEERILREGLNNEDWLTWFEELSYEYVFHEKSEAESVIEQEPRGESLFPITLEITAETKGDTLGQNKDNELSIEVNSDDCEALLASAGPYHIGSYYESSFSHTHYNGTSE